MAETTYIVTLRAPVDESDPNGFRRLRWALKTLLRRYQLRCVRAERVREPGERGERKSGERR